MQVHARHIQYPPVASPSPGADPEHPGSQIVEPSHHPGGGGQHQQPFEHSVALPGTGGSGSAAVILRGQPIFTVSHADGFGPSAVAAAPAAIASAVPIPVNCASPDIHQATYNALPTALQQQPMYTAQQIGQQAMGYTTVHEEYMNSHSAKNVLHAASAVESDPYYPTRYDINTTSFDQLVEPSHDIAARTNHPVNLVYASSSHLHFDPHFSSITTTAAPSSEHISSPDPSNFGRSTSSRLGHGGTGNLENPLSHVAGCLSSSDVDATNAATAIVTFSNVELKELNLSPRWGLASACLDGQIYIFGGYLWFHGVDLFFNDLYRVAPESSLIRRILPTVGSLPPCRFGHTLIADPYSHRLLLFGGRNSRETFSDLWSFYPHTNSWQFETSASYTPASPKTLLPSDPGVCDSSVADTTSHHHQGPADITQHYYSTTNVILDHHAGHADSSFDPKHSDAQCLADTSLGQQPPTQVLTHGGLGGSSAAGGGIMSCSAAVQPPRSTHREPSHTAGRVVDIPNGGVPSEMGSQCGQSVTPNRLTSPATSCSAPPTSRNTAAAASYTNGSILSTTQSCVAAPPPRSWHSAVLYNGNMYIYGGWDHANRAYGDVWGLEIQSNSWRCVWPCPKFSPSHPVASSFASPAAAVSSCPPAALLTDSTGTTSSRQDAVLDQENVPRENSGSSSGDADAPSDASSGPPDCRSVMPRSCHSAAVWGHEMYIFGGLGKSEKPMDDLFAFSLKTFEWRRVQARGAAPVGLTSAAGVVLSDIWVIHGGLSEYPNSGAAATRDVFIFHFPSAVWQQRAVFLPDSPATCQARYGHVAVAIPQPPHYSSHPPASADPSDYLLSVHSRSSFAVLLIGGAEKYATPASKPICRLDFAPSAAFAATVLGRLTATADTVRLMNSRVSSAGGATKELQAQLSAVSQSYKHDVGDLRDRHDQLQTQIVSLQQSVQSLHSQMTSLQQSMVSFEQFIPMMRNFGAAIANFGNWQPQASPSHR